MSAAVSEPTVYEPGLAESRADIDNRGDYGALVFNHMHTEKSNETESYRDIVDVSMNHVGDIPLLLDALPQDLDAIIVPTDHYEANPEVFTRDLPRYARNHIDRLYRYDNHYVLEQPERDVAVINGRESSVEEDHIHFLEVGIPVSSEETVMNIDTDELYERAKDNAITIAAHPHMLGTSTPKNLLTDFLKQSQSSERDFRAGLEVHTGYTPFFNRWSSGTGVFEQVLGFQWYYGKPVPEYSQEYDVPLVPGLDWHAALPEGLEGAGVVRDPTYMDELKVGRIPNGLFDRIEVVSHGEPGREGLRLSQFRKTFRMNWREAVSMLPKIDVRLPQEYYEDLRDDSLRKLSEDFTREELLEGSYDPVEFWEEGR